MNNIQNYIVATVLTAFVCGGCVTYPHPVVRPGYATSPGYTTYTTSPIAVETTTTYIEPYYGGYYYEEPYYGGAHHHRHGSGPQHGYGMGPIMPPRGAGPARQPTRATHGGRPSTGFTTPIKAHAAGKVAATQAHTAGKAAAIQMHSARNATAAQSRAASAQMHSANKAAAVQVHAARKAGATMPKRR